MKKYQAYLLDFDGTLFDTLESLYDPYFRAFSSLNIKVDRKDISNAIHFALVQTFDQYKITEQSDKEKFFRVFHETFNSEENIKKIKIFADVSSFLEKAKKEGKELGIVSGNSEAHIRLVLKEFALEKYFAFVVGGSADKRPKPYPDPILEALSKLPKISKEEVVYIGDSLQDPECAIASGIDGVLLDRNSEYNDYKGLKIENLLSLL